MKIGVLGAGSWGAALAGHLGKNGQEVTLWGHHEEKMEEIRRTRMIPDKLPGFLLPDPVGVTADFAKTVRENEILIFAVPSPAIRETAVKIKNLSLAEELQHQKTIVNVAKGLEEGTLLRLSEVIEEELPLFDVAVLSGPSHAEEVAQCLPTALVAGSKKKETAEQIQNVFMNEYLRVYTSPDLIGMELGGALKNVIALAAGMADGLGYGDNTKAALITRGVAEITRLAGKLGGAPETLSGLTGIGDLIVTCESRHSRNRKAGMLIGQGRSVEEALSEVGMVVEGVNTARAAGLLAQKADVPMPIITAVNNVLFSGKSAGDAVRELMIRNKRSESSRLTWETAQRES